jgi:hypothetical protein
MKLELVKISTVILDTDKERARINKCLADDIPARDRQLALIQALEDKDLKLLEELYDALPYNDKEGCPEQEFVGLWLRDWMEGISTERVKFEIRP